MVLNASDFLKVKREIISKSTHPLEVSYPVIKKACRDAVNDPPLNSITNLFKELQKLCEKTIFCAIPIVNVYILSIYKISAISSVSIF